MHFEIDGQPVPLLSPDALIDAELSVYIPATHNWTEVRTCAWCCPINWCPSQDLLLHHARASLTLTRIKHLLRKF